jgi:hypothetical protein
VRGWAKAAPDKGGGGGSQRTGATGSLGVDGRAGGRERAGGKSPLHGMCVRGCLGEGPRKGAGGSGNSGERVATHIVGHYGDVPIPGGGTVPIPEGGEAWPRTGHERVVGRLVCASPLGISIPTEARRQCEQRAIPEPSADQRRGGRRGLRTGISRGPRTGIERCGGRRAGCSSGKRRCGGSGRGGRGGSCGGLGCSGGKDCG